MHSRSMATLDSGGHTVRKWSGGAHTYAVAHLYGRAHILNDVVHRDLRRKRACLDHTLELLHRRGKGAPTASALTATGPTTNVMWNF